MKEWYTAAELARLALPGLPTTKMGMLKMAGRESWPSRRREGRGGGAEYHYVMLPRAARIELARRFAQEATPEIAHPGPESHAPGRHLGAMSPQDPPAANEKATPAASPQHAAHGSSSSSLAGLNGARKNRADARLALLAALDRYQRAAGFGVHQAEALFAHAYAAGEIELAGWVREAIGPTVSASSLGNWRRAVKKGHAADLAGRWKGRRDGTIDRNPVLADMIVARILASPHVNAAQIAAGLRAQVGETAELPSLRRLQAWIARWKDENADRLALATNPDAHRSARMPAFGTAAADIVRLNQLWEADGTPADVMCTDGRRKVVAVIDVFTRRARALVCESEKAAAIVALARRAMLDWGVPERIKTDNGAGFTARHVESALAGIGVGHDLCHPYSGWEKPHVERFIGTLSHELFEQLPGYVGHSVADRQAIRARETFARRLGQDEGEVFAVAMTATELQATIDTWIDAVYARRPHTALDGASPFDKAAAHAASARRVGDERALDVLLAPLAGDGWRTVQKKGIGVESGWFVAPELGAMVGERVQVRLDPADAGTILVLDADGAFVCWARDAAREGVDRASIAAQAKAKRAALDAEMRAEARRLKREYRPDHVHADVLRQAAEKADRVVAFPVPGEAHESDGLDQAAAALAARDRQPEPLDDDARREAADQLARIEEANAAPAPRADGEGRPIFDDDLSFVLWVREGASPHITDADRVYADELFDEHWWLREQVAIAENRRRVAG